MGLWCAVNTSLCGKLETGITVCESVLGCSKGSEACKKIYFSGSPVIFLTHPELGQFVEMSPGGAKHSARVLLKPFPAHAMLWLRKCHKGNQCDHFAECLVYLQFMCCPHLNYEYINFNSECLLPIFSWFPLYIGLQHPHCHYTCLFNTCYMYRLQSTGLWGLTCSWQKYS